jgi:hypothetical protein
MMDMHIWRWLALDLLELGWMLMWPPFLEHWRPCDNMLLAWRMPCMGGGVLDILEGGIEPCMALG